MRFITALVLLSLTTVFSGTPAQAAVKVTFAGTARHTDSAIPDSSVHKAIRDHLQRLGAQYLGRDERLSITVLDLDRAGFDLTSRGPSRPRLMNGATPPKMTLRYRLERNSRVVASGQDYLLDQNYLGRHDAINSGDELRYDKAMLDDWFRQKFAAGRTPTR